MFRRAKRGLVPGSLPPVPERMCVACRGRADQASLARFVVVDGAFRWDAARRHPGRGAYPVSYTHLTLPTSDLV